MIEHHALVEQFQIGKIHVQCILKRKMEYLDANEECAKPNSQASISPWTRECTQRTDVGLVPESWMKESAC